MPPVGPPPPEAGARLDSGPIQLAWRAEPAPIAVSRPFALIVTLCPAEARLLRVDATMPEHRHGMNYRPSLQPLGSGLWRVEGLLWHMAGRWELRLDVEAAGVKQSLRQSVTLP
ncbi:MAG: hypothetical protein IPI08_07240 [Betaproteobacteria bacterium]|nr:hypothetical protein [Betaproteobacteria bacterium]